MKTIVFFFILGFVWQSSDASSLGLSDILPACLIENGFTKSASDMELIYAIGDPQQADKLRGVSKEKMVNVITCLYRKVYPKGRLYDKLRQLLDRDDKVSKDQIKQMEEASYPCYKKAAGNDAVLLNCLNITEPPFDHLFVTFRDIPQGLHWCYVKCNVLISEMYTMERNSNNSFKEYVKYVPNEKLTCYMACKAEEETMNNPGKTFQERLAQLINERKNVDENTKKEMLNSLSRCSVQVSGVEDEYLELFKCLNPFKPPFLHFF